MTALADADLIDLVRTGDAAAIGELFRRHAPTATRAARSYTGSPHDADDVVSDVFASVWRAIRNGRGPTTRFEPYLIAAVKNRSRGAWAVAPLDAVADRCASAAEMEPAGDGMARRAFASLSAREREVLWLTAVEDRSSVEAGRDMAITTRAAATLKFRATRALAEAYLSEYAAASGRTGCRELSPALARYVRGRSSAGARRTIESHLAICPGCEQLVGELEDMNLRLRTTSLPLIATVVAWREHVRATLGRILGRAPWLKSIAYTSAAGAITLVPAVALFGGERQPTDPQPLTIDQERDTPFEPDEVEPVVAVPQPVLAPAAAAEPELPASSPASTNLATPATGWSSRASWSRWPAASDASSSTQPQPVATVTGQPSSGGTAPAPEVALPSNPASEPGPPPVTVSAGVAAGVGGAILNVELGAELGSGSISAGATVAATVPGVAEAEIGATIGAGAAGVDASVTAEANATVPAVGEVPVDAEVQVGSTGIDANVAAEVPEVTLGDATVLPAIPVEIDVDTADLAGTLDSLPILGDLLGG